MRVPVTWIAGMLRIAGRPERGLSGTAAWHGRGLLAFARSRAAAAAVEFAFILPVAMLLYIGAAEVTDGVMASRRVSTVTKTLVDLLSLQGTTTQKTSTPTPGNAVSSTTLSTLLTSATALMAPNPTSTLTMTISAIDVTNTAQGTCCSALVRWSYTQGGTLRPCVVQMTALASNSYYSTTQIPAGLLPYGTQLPAPLYIIISDVGYTYQAYFSQNLLKFAPTMQRTEYMLPRSMGQVTTSTLPSSGSQYGQVCY